MKYTAVTFLVLSLFINNVFSKDIKKEKKFGFEFSLGVARANPASIDARASGIDALIDGYAGYYGLTYSSSGEFPGSRPVIPFNISGHYLIGDKFFLQAGIDYSFSKASSGKTFLVAWQDFAENYEYRLSDRISCLMPHFGVGYRFASLDFYSALGLGFIRFTHIEELNYSEPGYWIETNDTFKVKGTAPAIIIGFKYGVRLNKRTSRNTARAFVKFETVLLKAKGLKGSKTAVAADSEGERPAQTSAGTLYSYGWNPYGTQRFDFWDIFESPPTDPAIQDARKLGLNLSGVRLMIGIRF